MARRTKPGDPEQLHRRLISLLGDFENRLEQDDLREQVRALIPAVHVLRDLGTSLLPQEVGASARDRILYYLRRYSFTIVAGDELAVVAGISEYARRIRELRVQRGWPIYSGSTVNDMLKDESSIELGDLFGPKLSNEAIQSMKSDDYVLVGEQDRDAAHRWILANEIRKLKVSMRDRLLRYLQANVGKPVTGEELRYVAGEAQSWPRRTRELRTEEGWPLVTRNSGRPDLPGGMYLLEADRQSPPHDRRIPDVVRVAVLERDDFQCRCCGWSPSRQQIGDRRTLLELHHIEHHAEGGDNDADNLITLCDVHHDEVHRRKLNGKAAFDNWVTENCN